MNDTKILLVEDNESFGVVLRDFLELENFRVELATDGLMAFEKFNTDKFDICLIDIMLPKMDGYNLIKKIREIDTNIPLIVTSAKSMKWDKLKGFDLGCDDYVTKPFDEDELVRRINALIRRTTNTKPVEKQLKFDFADFHYDHKNYVLKYKGDNIKITQKEANILYVLLLNKNEVVKRDDIMISVWGKTDYFIGRSLDVFITRIRKYLKHEPRVKIENKHGIGFVLTDI
ncbi:MAG: response regulator transcription factor [Marinifilaceae bacterium]|jgi:DNA-binding response OmpR family regulator|nr:response regulator transcription factor [Marinifilaceae bacterium]